MHNNSHPEREEREQGRFKSALPAPSGAMAAPQGARTSESLRHELASLRENSKGKWSNSKLSKQLGISETTISQYINGKYPGNIPGLESKIEDFLRNESLLRASGVETITCPETEQVRSALEYIRSTNDVGEILSASGNGKSRGAEVYHEANPTSILCHVRSWARDLGSIEGALFEAVGKAGWDRTTKRAIWMVKLLRTSNRLIIVDDAHKLTSPALQFLFDFHDETGCPMGFIGTYDLEDKLAKDEQQYSRVGLRYEIIPENPRDLIDHLVRSFAPDANGETAKLAALCEQVAKHHGHYRSVHKQLKLAAKIRQKEDASWCAAFRAAHGMLIRDFKLA